MRTIADEIGKTQDLKPVTVILPNPSALNVYALHSAIGEGYMEEASLAGLSDEKLEAIRRMLKLRES